MFKLGAMLFDAYGTLFDLTSAVEPHVMRLGDPEPTRLQRTWKELGGNTSRVLTVWRQKQLEYSWTATIRGEYRPFDVITRDALEFALAQELSGKQCNENPTLVDDLMLSFARLKPVDGANEALKALKARGLRLGILSNGTPEMLAKLIEGHAFAAFLDPDLILSADMVKAYKPDRRVYQLGVDKVGLPTDEIGFVSANGWDAAGAAGFGFDTYWISSRPYEAMLRRKVLDIEGLHVLPHAIP
jgi:2-haloacid dehalogenase